MPNDRLRTASTKPVRKHQLTTAAAFIVTLTSGMAVASDDSGLYVPKPNPGAKGQIASLKANGQKAEARLIRELIKTPQAAWFTGKSPTQVKEQVAKVVADAAAEGTVPVLVAYNIPFRDCAQFSAGGATTTGQYKRWIRAFAEGIGDAEAIVVVEPDGLGVIPYYTDINGNAEWCQPPEATDPATADDERFDMLNYAVDVLKAQPNVAAYLDGTHSAWLGVGDIADRLVKAGVDRADGFFLNASNYQYSANLVQYGTWISSCIASGDYAGCANQYWNGGPEGTKIAELLGPWTGGALSNYGEWSDESDDPALNTSGINARFSSPPTTHFVIDTSRNGQGPWVPGAYPDAMDWCNPPGRGLGYAPTMATGNELIDAYLWIKIPGESDGECTRGLGPAGTTVDPEWGLIDPAAGQSFPEMALDLAVNANQ
jgi:endoglucanase